MIANHPLLPAISKLILVFSVVTMTNPVSPPAVGQTPDTRAPQTVAESSDFEATSTSAEVAAFIEACDAKAGHVRKFVWGQTVEEREMVGAIVATEDYQIGDQDQRNVVLLLGNIHSGECAGKEALLMILRELTYDPDNAWLKNSVIIFAPNYNADGNDRIGLNNRPGQAGPVKGMGRRENAQQLDLNRDFCKIESPEARALVALINKTNPHLFVDCHTTNGSIHQYSLTYDIPHNPATAEPIRNFLRQKMMPAVTTAMLEKGEQTFYYGNFNRDQTKWTTYGHEPRYSTEYVGLRGRLSVLSEAYSYLDYRGRIFASKKFVESLVDYVSENREVVHQLLESVESDFIEAAQQAPMRLDFSLSAKVSAFDDKVAIKGIKDEQPHDYECEFWGKYDSAKSTPLPFAYLIPAAQGRVADRLRMHGVAIESLTEATSMAVEVDRVTVLDQAPRAFQKHKMVRLEAERTTATREFPAGTFVVRTAQPLGRLVAYMLESESDDGFAVWNFFDDAIAVGKEFPIARLPQPTELKTDSVDEIKPTVKLSLDAIDGPNRLLANLPKAPKWFGSTDLLQVDYSGREAFIDAASAALVRRPARPYRAANVAAALVDAGLDQEAADSLAQADPQVATNGRSAIFVDGKHAAVYFLNQDSNDAGKSKAAVQILQPAVDSSNQTNAYEGAIELVHYNDDETKVAFWSPAGLSFFDLESKTVTTVVAESEKHLVGKLDWVYQEELYGRGNFKGYWWQPAGNQVAFLKLDETPLLPFTVMDHLPVRGELEATNYPKAGDPNPLVAVGLVDASDASKRTWVDLSKYDGEQILVTGVTWAADGSHVLLQVQNREQTWLDLVAVDADGANMRVLFRDQTPAWIESPGDPVFLDDGEFVWRSPRSGYSQLYRYAADGQLLGELTSGQWEVRSVLGVNPEKTFVYFTATKENATEVHGYRVAVDSGEITRLTTLPGTHSLSFNDAFTMFVDTFSDLVTVPTHYLCRADGTVIRRLNVSSDDRLSYLQIATPEFLVVDSGGDQPLDAMLIKPADFDPNKKYPVVIHIYAGPQAPRVRNQFGGTWYLWHQMLAQQGYVVWLCDNRSASFRSTKNVWPVHRNFAENELADIETGVDWLKRQPWVDGDRIGLWGWSYGGYMTAYALTRSDSFKVGISGAPVTDWKNYDSIYTERYMGLPESNADGYEASSVLNENAKNLSGKLLLIHGTVDDNVHLNNSMQFVKELQNANQDFELMLYPGNRHSITDKRQAAHLRMLMTRFLQENL